MLKVLVSACLLGEPVRYHGGHAKSAHAILARWVAQGRVVSVCPEVLGGLATPRPSAEIVAAPSNDKANRHVVTADGVDLSGPFSLGAFFAADLATSHGVRVAVLKDGSPSCGSSFIHDGTFTGHTIRGEGIAAAMLRSAGIAVFSENDLEGAEQYLTGLENDLA